MPDRESGADDRERVARAALLEVTRPADVGPLTGEQIADGIATLSFEAALGGYPGWHWSVSLAELPGRDPTVLETELVPGEGALLAPDWLPWSERQEEYRAAQIAAGVVDDADVPDDDDADDELDDLDDDAVDDADDVDDGIDFESAELTALDDSGVSAVGVDEQDEAEAEADEDRPE